MFNYNIFKEREIKVINEYVDIKELKGIETIKFISARKITYEELANKLRGYDRGTLAVVLCENMNQCEIRFNFFVDNNKEHISHSHLKYLEIKLKS